MARTTSAQTGRPNPAERRVDARRNYEQILLGAMAVLKADPTASLQDIAASVGLHRATLHRHFRSREELVAVLRERSALRTLQELDVYDLSTDPTAERIPAFTARVIANAVPTGMWRYATYYGAGMDGYTKELQARSVAMMEEGRRDGALRTDLDAEALVLIWRGVLFATLPQVDRGALTVEQAVALVMAALAPGR